MSVSIVIRTYNEARYLAALLSSLRDQQIARSVEVIVVDSGSSDNTLAIAASYGARIVSIAKHEFSFGRSLNTGCAAAVGDYLVFISGHCVPVNDRWLAALIEPLHAGTVAMTYGRQVGGPESKFSEMQLFRKFYPPTTRIPQEGFFCNNANSALLRSVWNELRFDEDLTGLEDLAFGRRLISSGRLIGYVADAAVYHHHHETWTAVRRRYEREAIALQHIMPEIHISVLDFARYFCTALFLDVLQLVREGVRLRRVPEIVMFRLMQFWGSYRGNHEHRQLSQRRKELYFYPRQRE